MAAHDDELGGGFIPAGLLSLGWETPGGDWMAPAGGTSFAAAMRMIDGIHRHAAIVRHASHPALAPGLADRNVHIVGIGDGTNAGHAAAMHEALLGGIETQDHVFAVAPDDLRISIGKAGRKRWMGRMPHN